MLSSDQPLHWMQIVVNGKQLCKVVSSISVLKEELAIRVGMYEKGNTHSENSPARSRASSVDSSEVTTGTCNQLIPHKPHFKRLMDRDK